MTGLSGALSELRRAVSWHRRLLAAGLVAAAVAFSLSALSPASPPTVAVLVAASDLPGGQRIDAGDVRTARLPADAVPEGALTGARAAGAILAAPVRRGEVLTDVRLVGRALLSTLGPAELVGAPVRIADAGAVALLRSGDTVDVLAASAPQATGEASASVVASRVRVLAVPGAGADPAGTADGALVVLAVTADAASSLARAAVDSRLSVTLHGHR